jgi:elongation factor Ts
MSYKPSADDVKRLREATGAGMIDCRNALVQAEGDFERAKTHLL